MLYLLFDIGHQGYAMAANLVVEMLPFIAPMPVRGAHSMIAGSISYRGQFVPVIDLTQLEQGVPTDLRMGTRIVITELKSGDQRALVGLITENATETLRCSPDAFRPFATGPRGLVQLLDLDTLLPPHLFDALTAHLEPEA